MLGKPSLPQINDVDHGEPRIIVCR